MALSAPPPSWASIKNKPTTVSGFGISDMASQSVANATNATNVSNVTTAQVLAATAGATAGAVGSFALMKDTVAVTRLPNATLAGSSLRYSSLTGPIYTGSGVLEFTSKIYSTVPLGTWRCMSYSMEHGDGIGSTLWLRIS